MRNFVVIGLAAVVVAVLAIGLIGLRIIRSERCRLELAMCNQECDRTRDLGLNENQFRRSQIQLELGDTLLYCRLDNLGNQAAIDQCQQEANNAAATELAQLDASDEAIRDAHAACLAACEAQATDCDNAVETPTLTVKDDFEIDCISGNNAPCFKDVLEICTMIAGPCDDCWRTLCGDSAWTFESAVPLEVSLVAAAGSKKDVRVLAASTLKGKQAVLSIPQKIEIKGTERLYLQFSSSERPSGAVKVSLQRSR